MPLYEIILTILNIVVLANKKNNAVELLAELY